MLARVIFFIITIGTSILPRSTPPPPQALDDWDKASFCDKASFWDKASFGDLPEIPTLRLSPRGRELSRGAGGWGAAGDAIPAPGGVHPRP